MSFNKQFYFLKPFPPHYTVFFFKNNLKVSVNVVCIILMTSCAVERKENSNDSQLLIKILIQISRVHGGYEAKYILKLCSFTLYKNVWSDIFVAILALKGKRMWR